MNITNKDLKKRILEISYKYKLSHLGSCFTAVDIIDEIYSKKEPNEKFVLSSGHAGLALYVVIEKYEGIGAEKIFNHHGVHPDRCVDCHIACSSGSLGHGLPIAMGMAISDRSKNIYCLISDGECSEGSIWEAMRIAKEQNLSNLKLHLNQNGWGAYKEIPFDDQFNIPLNILDTIWTTNVNQLPFLKGQNAHYHVMTEGEYKLGMKLLS